MNLDIRRFMFKTIDDLLRKKIVFADECAEYLTKDLCDKAVISSPNSANAYNARGVFYSFNKNYERAVEEFNKAVLINGNDWTIRFNLGYALSKAELYDEAAEHFRKVLSLNPDSNFIDDGRELSVVFGANHMLGACLVFNGKYAESIKYLDSAIKLNPSVYESYSCRATAKMELGDEEGAMKDLKMFSYYADLLNPDADDIISKIVK